VNALLSNLRRVLAFTFAALVIQLFLLDPSTNHVTPVVPLSEAFDGSLEALASQTYARRDSDLVVLSQEFTGSRVFESGLRPEHRWSRSLLGAVGRVERVASGYDTDMPPVVRFAPVQEAGNSRRGDWTILAAESGARDFAYVSIGANEYAYVDFTLIPRVVTGGEGVIVFEQPKDYGEWHVALKEWGLFSILLGLGLVLLRGTSIDSRIRPWAAFPLGIAALAAVGVLLPRGVVGLALVALIAGSLVLFRVAGRERASLRSAMGLDSCAVHHLAAAIIALGAVSSIARRFRLYFVTPDSFDYLGGAFTLGLGKGPLSSASLDTSFYIGQQTIHAAGYALGIGPLYSVGWALLVCMAATLAGLVRHSWFSELIGNHSVAAFLIVSIASASPYVWRFAAYVNAHMFIAALLLLILLIFSDMSQTAANRFGLSLLLFSAFVFTRGEAPLVIALVLVGFAGPGLLRERCRLAHLWLALAAPNFALAALVARLHAGTQEAPRSVFLSAAIGVACVVAWSFARNPVTARYLRGVWIVPWLALAVVHFFMRSVVPGGLSEPFENLRLNVLNIGAEAGVFPLLMLLLAVALAVGSHSADAPHLSAVRTLILGYLPAVMLARSAAPTAWASGSIMDPKIDGIIRAGFGDSTNRVLFHLWFVLIAGFLLGEGDIRSARRPSRWARVTVFVVTLGLAAQQWVAQVFPLTAPYRWAGWALVALFAGLFLHSPSGLRPLGQEEEPLEELRAENGARSGL